MKLTDEEIILLVSKMYYELNMTPDNIDTFVDFETLKFYCKGKTTLDEIKIVDYKIQHGIIYYAIMENKEKQFYFIFPGTYENSWKKIGTLGYSDGLEDAFEILRYLEGSEIANITTVGCGLGGNIAQFLAIKSVKVNYCVTIDSPGFSNDFFDKNLDLISKNKNKIHSYMTEGTIIGRLFWNLSDETEISQCINELGNLSYFKIDNNYKLSFLKSSIFEESKFRKLSGAIMNTLPLEEKKKLFDFTGILLQHMFGYKAPDFSRRYTENEQKDFIYLEEHAEMIASLLAFAQKLEIEEEWL